MFRRLPAILLILIVVAASSGCGGSAAAVTPTAALAQTTQTSSGTVTESDVDFWYATVNDVASGDLVLLDNGQWVRYAGLLAPGKGGTGDQEATDLNKSLVLGKRVKLEVDPDYLYDLSGRLWAYVWVGDQIVNYSLVRSGWAKLLYANTPCHQRWSWLMSQGQAEAKAGGDGLWGPTKTPTAAPTAAPTEAPTMAPTEVPTVVPTEPPVLPAPPTQAPEPTYEPQPAAVHQVIANPRSGIYHDPSCHYGQLVSNKIWYDRPSDAIADGYRPCKRCNPPTSP